MIESDVVDIKCILSDVNTKVEDDGYQSPPNDVHQPPDFTRSPPSGGNTSINHPLFPSGPPQSNMPPLSSQSPHNQTLALTLQTHSQVDDAKKEENLSNSHTEVDTYVIVEYIRDCSDIDDKVYFMDLSFMESHFR